MQIDLDNEVPTHPTEGPRSLLEINLNCVTWISDTDGLAEGRRQAAALWVHRREAH